MIDGVDLANVPTTELETATADVITGVDPASVDASTAEIATVATVAGVEPASVPTTVPVDDGSAPACTAVGIGCHAHMY